MFLKPMITSTSTPLAFGLGIGYAVPRPPLLQWPSDALKWDGCPEAAKSASLSPASKMPSSRVVAHLPKIMATEPCSCHTGNCEGDPPPSSRVAHDKLPGSPFQKWCIYLKKCKLGIQLFSDFVHHTTLVLASGFIIHADPMSAR